MQLTTTFSKSGKTMYYAVKLDDSCTIKTQSRLKAKGILASLNAESVVSLDKVKRNWLLTIDNNCFGRLTKTDFTKLVNYLENLNENPNKISNQSQPSRDQIPHQSSLSVLSGNGILEQWSSQILPDRQQLRYRSVDFVLESSNLVFTSSEGLAYLNWIDSQISTDESSSNQFIASCAELERSQLQTAMQQRQLGSDQRQLGSDQRQLGSDQRQLGSDQRNLARRIFGGSSKYVSANTAKRLTSIINSGAN
jgi:hypothetical protein